MTSTQRRFFTRIGLAIAVGSLGVACASGRGAGSAAGTTVTPPTSASTTTVATPSTVTGTAAPLHIPFTADQGALVVTSGAPPHGMTSAAAAQVVAVVGHLWPVRASGAPMAGTVNLRSGLGIPPIDGEPAWIVPVRYIGEYACPMIAYPTPSIPPWASHLTVAIVTGPSPGQRVLYVGVGAGPCQPAQRPSAQSAAQL